MSPQRKYVAIVLLAAAAILWAHSSPHSPFAPPPKPQRPVLTFLMRVARMGLWFAAFAEPAPQQREPDLVMRGPDGNQSVAHGRGW
jgi:hypothetical protein